MAFDESKATADHGDMLALVNEVVTVGERPTGPKPMLRMLVRKREVAKVLNGYIAGDQPSPFGHPTADWCYAAKVLREWDKDHDGLLNAFVDLSHHTLGGHLRTVIKSMGLEIDQKTHKLTGRASKGHELRGIRA